MAARRVWLHTTDGVMRDPKAYACLKTEAEVRDYFEKFVKEMPIPLPSEKISLLFIRHRSEDGNETWVWSDTDACVEMTDGDEGWLISVNNSDIYDSSKEQEEEEEEEEEDEEEQEEDEEEQEEDKS